MPTPMTEKQVRARQDILACVAQARESLARLEYLARSGESFIGSESRANAREIAGWMGYIVNDHANRADAGWNLCETGPQSR